MAESALEIISEIDEMCEVSDFLEDQDIDEAMSLIVRLIMNPDVSPQKAPPLIVKVTALSAKFQVMAATYTNLRKGKAGSDEYKKKNLYYSLADALEKLSNSLKYLVRNI